MMNPFKKKKDFVVNKLIGIIEPTDVAIENETIDKFNKQINIHNGVAFIKGEILWGRKIDEIPFSKEAVKSLEEIREVIMIERKIKPQIFEEPDFGGFLT